MSTAAGPARQAGFRAFATRRPVAGLLVLVFGIGYPVLFLLVLVSHGVLPGGAVVGSLPLPVDEVAGLALTLLALLPSALYVTWAADGSRGVRQLLGRVVRWRFDLRWWVFVITALPVLTLLVGLLLGDALRPVALPHVLAHQLRELLVNLLLVNLWEETAWAGVLQTRLQRTHGLLAAGAWSAVPFGLMHWPLAFFGDVTATSALLALPAYVLLGLLLRPLGAFVMDGARGSVLAFALLHSVFNRTNNPDGIAAALVDGTGREIGILVAPLLLTGALVLLHRRRYAHPDHHGLLRRTTSDSERAS